MTSDTDAKYFLIACGTSDYQSDEYDNLSKVPHDLDKVSQVLKEWYGYERLFQDLSLNFDKQALLGAFQDWLLSGDRSPNDHVIIYYSGHGDYDQNNQHYLILNDTKRKLLASPVNKHSGLMTTDFLSLFKAEGIKAIKVLFIIDTCYAGLGGGNIAQYVASQLEPLQPIEGPNLFVASITASRGSQLAVEGILSRVMTTVLQQWQMKDPFDHFSLSEIVTRMNQIIDDEEQTIEHNLNKFNQYPKFFRRILFASGPTWDSERPRLINRLIRTLKTWDDSAHRADDSKGLPIYWLNTYFLLKNKRQRYLSSWSQWKKELHRLSEQAVSQEIWDLYAYVSWCIESIRDCQRLLPGQLINDLEIWQSEVSNYHDQIQPEHIDNWINSAKAQWCDRLEQDEHRLLITLKPERDEENNLGETGNLLMSAQLWLSKDTRPLFESVRDKVLNLKPFFAEYPDPLNALCACLLGTSDLIHLIQTIRTLFPKNTPWDSDLRVEIYLPLQYFSAPLELLTCQEAGETCRVGQEYIITLNSYARYFDMQFSRRSQAIARKKEELWVGDQALPLAHDSLNMDDHPTNNPDNKYQFDDSHLYVGNVPSVAILKKIERSFPIALWSRTENQLIQLGKDFQLEEWAKWPENVQQFRRRKQGNPLTLFWDDKFPEPQEFATNLTSLPQ